MDSEQQHGQPAVIDSSDVAAELDGPGQTDRHGLLDSLSDYTHNETTSKKAPWSDRVKLEVTAGYCVSFICLGMIAASLGPVYLELSERTDISISTFGWLFTSRSLGYLTGSVIGGPMYDKYTGNTVLFWSMVFMAGGNIVIPLARNFFVLMAGVVIESIAMGFLDTGGNVLLIRAHEGKSGSYMHILHLCFGIGSLIAPLFIRASMAAADGRFDWSFYGISLFILVIAAVLLKLPSPDLPTPQAEEHSEDSNAQQNKTFGLPRLVLVLCLHVSVQLFVYVGLEVGYGAFLLAYGVESVGISEAEGQYLTSLYWGALSFGRFMGIFIAMRISAKWMLIFDFIGCTLGGLIIWILQDMEVSLWIGSFIFGTSMGSIFPSTISLCESYVAASGRVASFFVMGAAFGETFIPMLLGQLLGNVSYNAFPIIATVLPVFMAIILSSLVRAAAKLEASSHKKLNEVELTPQSPLESGENPGV